MSPARPRSQRRFLLSAWLVAAGLMPCASCTDLMLTRYRNEALIRSYRYALGEQYVTVDGLRLCYQDVCKSGAGADPSDTVLILPGLGTSIDFWQKAVAAVGAQHRVLALDAPGFGKSEKPNASYDITWMSERVVHFLDAMHVKRVSILGGSMGGHLALLIALNHPERVDKIVLVGSVGGWERPGPILDAALRLFWSDWLVNDHMRRNWPRIYSMLTLHPTPRTQEMFLYQMALRARTDDYWPEGRASSRTLRSIIFSSCRDRLGQLRKPVMIVWGRQDHIHSPMSGFDFRVLLPDARLVIVPDSGHLVMVDQPETFNRLVLDFLRGGTAAVQDSSAYP